MIQPIGMRVVVKRLPKRQEGLIINPDIYNDPSQIGEVLALGTGKPGKEFTVKVGEHVLLPTTYGGGHSEIEIDGHKNVCIISEDNLLGILDE